MVFVFLFALLVLGSCYGGGKSFLTYSLFKNLSFRFEEIVFVGFCIITSITELLALFLPLTLALRASMAGSFFLLGIVFLFQKFRSDKRLFLASAVILCVFIATLIFKEFDRRIGWDTRLYHLMSIRWMHEFGTVPGLANLDIRLGFNSSLLSFAALFDVDGKSPLWISVFGYSILFLMALSAGKALLKRLNTSDLFLFASASTALFSHSFLNSLYQEPFVIASAIFIGSSLLRVLSNAEDKSAFVMLCFAAVAGVFIKKNMAYLSIFALLTGFCAPFRKNKTALPFFGFSFFVAAFLFIPNLLRSVVLSGYPFFPLKIFSVPVDWKVPETLVQNKLISIEVFRRGNSIPLEQAYNMTMNEWFPIWVNDFGKSILPLAILLGLGFIIWTFSIARQKTSLSVFLTGIFFLSLPLITFLSIAQPRFLNVWLPTVSGSVVLGLFTFIKSDNLKKRFLWGIVILGGLSMLHGIKDGLAVNRPGLFSHLQYSLFAIPEEPKQAFIRHENIFGNTVFVPEKGEWPGYNFPLPSVSRLDRDKHRLINSGPAWRGTSLENGFYTSEPEKIVPFGNN